MSFTAMLTEKNIPMTRWPAFHFNTYSDTDTGVARAIGGVCGKYRAVRYCWGAVTHCKPEQPENAPAPSDVTESDMTSEVSPLQPVNALLPI